MLWSVNECGLEWCLNVWCLNGFKRVGLERDVMDPGLSGTEMNLEWDLKEWD